MASEYRCVGCGFKVKSLFIQYSPGNIRLMKCVSFTILIDFKFRVLDHVYPGFLDYD